MNYKILSTSFFEKELKNLSKKYRSIKIDFKELLDFLEDDPLRGIRITGSIFKIRWKNSDILRGKSGGYRIIYYVLTKNKEVFLLSIYAKSERENITKEDIKDLTNYAKSIKSNLN